MSRRIEKNVGVIGLGIIGQRVASRIRSRGFHAFVWNRTPRPFPNFVGSPAEIAQLCNFVQIFVSDDEALLEMVQQMKQSLTAHHVVMAHSTVAPYTMRAAAEVVQRRGAQFLDAPFTGSKIAAEKGELVYYIGGDDAAYRRARPVLEASSKEIIEIGEIGQATTIKLATNMVTAATVQVAAEALALVHSAGLPLEKFAAAMRSNGSNSGTLTMKLPKMIEGDFEPHFSVKHMLKDVEIAARLARSSGLMFGGTEAARDSLVTEARRNRGDQDYSSMVHAFFPDGLPGKTAETGNGEIQSSLELDEQTALAPGPKEEEPEPTILETTPAEPILLQVSSEAEEADQAAESATSADVERQHSDETLVADELTEPDSPPEVRDMQTAEAPVPVEAREISTEEARTEQSGVEDKAGGAPVAPPVEATPLEAETEQPRRGFFSRMFSKGADY